MAAAAGTTTEQPTYKDNILQMHASYTGQKQYNDGYISLPSKSMKNWMFLGSAHAIFFSSRSKMEHESPACIAAPLVNMVAKEAISLGVNCRTSADKVVIYAPEQLSISAKHVIIGNIKLMVTPRAAFITCKNLTLLKSQETDPDYFSVVKSWLVNDDTDIEVKELFFDADPQDEKKS